jgi:hypothetical protein
MPTPEEHAREQIDAMLVTSGWVVQDFTALNLGIGQGIALCEVLLESGRCDYLLLVNRKPLGVIEAKKAGTTLSTEAHQSIIVDAVGVCESDRIDSRPLEKKPIVALYKPRLGVVLGKRDEDILTTLAGDRDDLSNTRPHRLNLFAYGR